MSNRTEINLLFTYIKAQRKYIAYQCVFLSVIIAFFLLFQLDQYVFILFFIFCLAGNFLYLLSEYIPRRRYYQELLSTLSELQPKELAFDVLAAPTFWEGKLTNASIQLMSDYMKEQMYTLNHQILLQQTYMDAWMHEIKTPLACLKLISEHTDNVTSRKINSEIERIYRYLEQVLYVSKVATATEDYLIKKVSLEKIVQESLKANSYYLIENHASIKQDNLHIDVYTDEKWLQFILSQIIVNAIKYKKETVQLHFEASKTDTAVLLKVTDFGQGIPKTDLNKVFQKGYTGENGHATNNATGIGLYLCKMLADTLYLGITIESSVDEWTTVTLTIPLKREFIERK